MTKLQNIQDMHVKTGSHIKRGKQQRAVVFYLLTYCPYLNVILTLCAIEERTVIGSSNTPCSSRIKADYSYCCNKAFIWLTV